ncbi:MAG: sugar phosphate isomerase/epimerase family protein [Armatimonadota bacterium]|nr:sugar phosphate isomerase/epimerase [Armatimonadota bacterium]MCX7778397.1 sugar phosphate isomerase/epimerase [Armatimonadota bacterium]MDW8026266.1 sugar phosphate isomerase/epimerase family protein [Armatimonadota bacterium]
MKVGIYFGTVLPDASLNERMELVKHAGYDGIEIPQPGSEEEARQIKEAAQAHGIEIHSIMGGVHWQFPLSSPDEETRRKGVEGIEQALHLASVVGAGAVLVVPGVVNERTDYKTAWEISMKSLKHLREVARREGVFMLIENVWNRFLLSPIEFCQFVDELNEGNGYVGAYFDVGNILIIGYPEQWIRMLGGRIKRVHIKDFDLRRREFVWLFEGDVNWRAVHEALIEIGYDSYLTAELPPYRTAADQFVIDTAQHIRRIIEGRV